MLYDLLIQLEKSFTASPLAGLAVSFLAGVLVFFSPCILPLVPVTLGITGAVSASSRMKGLAISAVFVLGICCTYTLLGIVAAFFGILINKFLLNPVVYLLLGVLFLFLGSVTLGIVHIGLPFFSMEYNPSRRGIFLFLLGMASGLAVIPCNYPVLGAILTMISLRQNVWYGALALFLFSLGYGTMLMILGTFTALLRKLPAQGKYLLIVKRALGVILILIGLYFFYKGIRIAL